MEITNYFTVTEKDIDVFKHMNYKRYIDLFEEERANWFIEIGLPFAEMAAKGFAVVILKLETEYKKEARLGERLSIETAPQNMGTKSFSLEQMIYNEKHELITASICTFVMFDLNERKSMPVVKGISSHFPVNVKF